MSQNKKQNFLKGTLIIAIASIIVKIIGAIYKIPLRRSILGPDGIGIYNAAYSIYNVLFIIATAGIPVAISKIISENIAKNNYSEVKKTYSVAKILLAVISLAGALVMFLGAGYFADYLKAESSKLAIMALSPSLFFVGLMSVYRGFNQGMGDMVPTAVSEVIEAFGKLILGLLLAFLFIPMGKETAAAGAILGVSTGTFISCLYLWGYNNRNSKIIKDNIKLYGEKNTTSKRGIVKKILSLAIPITLGSSVFTLASVIDLAMIMRQLATLGYDEIQRTTLYGYYSCDAVTLFNLPTTIITSLCISIVPFIAGALALNKKQEAKQTVETAIRLTLMFALPCAIGMSVLSKPILNFVMGDYGAAKLLGILSYGIIFLSIVMVSNSILQSMGKVWLPVFHMCIGGAVKIFVNYVLVGNPAYNINGAPIGTDLCYLVTAILNMISISRELKPSYGFGFLIKITLSTIVMGYCAYTSYTFIEGVTGYKTGLLAGISVGVLVYFILIILLKAIKKEDIAMMPKSEKIQKILGKFI